MVQISEVVFGFFFFFHLLKIVHFHNLRVSLGMSRVYICSRGPDLQNYEWFLS